MISPDLISIIIRTKNEERWITQCLQSVFSQTYKNFEVIIIDNESTDKTIAKARQFPISEIVNCREYRPGRALNVGIKMSKGRFIVCLSGHCIPVSDNWLNKLLSNFEDAAIAGVYGRQEPMSFTPDSDKRDLTLIFGMDRKVQEKDSFFHNANSMITREVWDKIKFSEEVTNIEDRVWAQEVLKSGYKIIYEPEASVYHYHGIHQDGDVVRCSNVVKILEALHGTYNNNTIDIAKLNISAIIPIRGDIKYLNGKPLIAYTIERAKESRYLKRIIVATDTEEMASLARSLGAEAPFIRDSRFSRDDIDLDTVMRYSLEELERRGIFLDLVVSLEATFPFRPKGLIDEMVTQLAQNGLDTVIVAQRENKAIWKLKNGAVTQLDEGSTPRKFKDPTYIELRGVAAVTHPEFVRQGRFVGQKIGLYEVNDPYAPLEVRDEDDFKLASLLMNSWVR